MSIASYELQEQNLTSSITGIGVELGPPGGLVGQIAVEIQKLRTNGPTFYDYKRGEMASEIDEYKYTVTEISAAVGMTVGDLVIKKMNNLDIIDGNNLQLTLNRQSLTAQQQEDLTNQIGTLAQQNAQINILLNRLNPLEIQFRALLQLVEEERDLKIGTGGFISAKKELFNEELSYYENDADPGRLASLIAGGYNTRFTAVNGKAASIRAKMGERDLKYNEIRAVLQDTNVRDKIQNILGGAQRFPDMENETYVGVIISVDNTVILDETRNPATLSDYSIIPSLPLPSQ
jgi:hypothetical protein